MSVMRSILAVCGILFVSLPPALSLADLTVVREVVTAPRTVNAVANIGLVNGSARVAMTRARVDIRVGDPAPRGGTVSVAVYAVFDLENITGDQVEMTVGFPVSNSEFTSFELEWFRVETDGEQRDVFRRTGSYPRRIVHRYVSGPSGPRAAKPPQDAATAEGRLFGQQSIGSEHFQNLMVWSERFGPYRKRRVEVRYELGIPLQENSVVRTMAEGNYKGIWPQEANNVPLSFLGRIPDGAFYFFDYYLTTGASWSGPIGYEEVLLHLGPAWKGHRLYFSVSPGPRPLSGMGKDTEMQTTYRYTLKNSEPAENLYFALMPPEMSAGPDGSTAGQHQHRVGR